MDHFAGLDVSVKETSVRIVDDTGMKAAIPWRHLDVSFGQKKTLNTWFWEVERGQHLPAPKNAENGQLTSDT